MIRSDNLLSRPLFRGGGGARGNRSGTSFQNMTARELMWQLVFPPCGGSLGDFAFWADGLGDLHQNPFARSICNHSGHYWRVFGIGCALMGRLRLVRQFAVCTTNVSPCRVLSGILRNLVRLCRQHRLHCTAVGTKENGSASTTENPGRVCGTASPPPRPGPDPPPYLWRRS